MSTVLNFGFEPAPSSFPPPPVGQAICGSFYDTTTQTTAQDTPTPMKLNTTDPTCTVGVSIVNDGLGNPTLITVSETGIYNLEFSAQLYRTQGGSPKTIDIWLRKNNINVPDSNTKVSVLANSVYLLASWNWYVQLNAGQFVQIMWAVNDFHIQLQYESENLIIPHPAIPSVIATIDKIR